MCTCQSNLTISDIHFRNFNGVTSGKRDPDVGTIVCSSPEVCILSGCATDDADTT